MNHSASRCLTLFLAVLVAIPPAIASAAVSPAYEEGYRLYRDGDYRGTVRAVEAGWTGAPDDALLLGLARLRLDEPARAAEAWARFIKSSPDAKLAGEVARLRTIVVREANRRAAAAAVGSESEDRAAVSDHVVAVLPFRNVGAARFEPLGKAVAAMLSDSLAGIPTTRVVGRGRVEAFLEAASENTTGDTKVARRVGRMLGAGMVVVGAHVDTQADPMTLEVDSAVIDTASGERIESGSFLAPLDRFYVAVRDTAVAIASRLEGGAASALPAAGERLRSIHTESLDAALAFGRGLDLEDRGDLDGARREYERALGADRSFRLARRQLATLPAALMSLPAVATAVQSELTEVAPPVVVAVAPTPSPAPTPAPTSAATPTPTAAAYAAAAGAAAGGTAAVVGGAAVPSPGTRDGASAPAPADEDETTILGMSPLTAGLVGAGVAIAIGAGAALAGGGGGGGDGGGGNDPVRPPTLTGVENRTVGAGDLIVLDVEGQDPEGSTVTLSQSGAPSAATFDTSSGNPATGTFRWQTTASDGGQTVDVTFTATASRGPPNDTESQTATLSVLAAPPTPTPPPMCGGTGASCTAAAECCQDIPRECDVTPAGGGTRCCLGFTIACQVDADCCGASSACRDQQCCAPLGVACSAPADCCDEGATCSAGSCCLVEGRSCSNDVDCCTGRCADGVCEGSAPPTPTPTPVPTPTPDMCLPRGAACDAFFECCPQLDCEQTPTSQGNLCCSPTGAACDDAGDCCGVASGCEEVCCKPLQAECFDASECCGLGAGCVLGRCCSPPGGSCTTAQDCCAGTCNAGTCSATLQADAVAERTPAPTARPTPSPSPRPTPTAAPFF